jgi:Pentapeptide repeats (8 copies)
MKPSRHRMRRWGSLGLAVVAALVVIAALAFLVVKVAPEHLATSVGDKAKADEVARTRTALLAFLAGLTALAGGVMTWLTLRLNRRGQITERFTRAVDQLGHSSLDVKVGGIYALERIAKDSTEYHPPVVDVLTTYVREHAPRPPKPSRVRPAADVRPPADIQAALTVLGRRETRYDTASIDLEKVDLRGARLEKANLKGSTLRSSLFKGARLDEANLDGADLSFAELGAYSDEGPITALNGASLRHANLSFAALMGVAIRRADLTGADLNMADLAGALLDGTTLTSADLTGVVLDTARFDSKTKWPSGFSAKDAEAIGAHQDAAAYQRRWGEVIAQREQDAKRPVRRVGSDQAEGEPS